MHRCPGLLFAMVGKTSRDGCLSWCLNQVKQPVVYFATYQDWLHSLAFHQIQILQLNTVLIQDVSSLCALYKGTLECSSVEDYCVNAAIVYPFLLQYVKLSEAFQKNIGIHPIHPVFHVFLYDGVRESVHSFIRKNVC